MLEIENLHVQLDGRAVLKGLSLSIQAGEVHAIMGPNGSGKSTLSKVIAGHPDYTVTAGDIRFEINFKMKNLLELAPHERACEGVFLAFQYPIEIAGVSNIEFLRASFNAVTTHQGGEALDIPDFEDFVSKKALSLEMDPSFLRRGVNAGFSGGEKKRNEVLQMAVLSPRLSVLDEADSGLDVDALKQVAKGINSLKTPDNAFVLITHYQRLLDYVEPDWVHILWDGRIVKSGDKNLALEIEKHGYEKFLV